VLTYVRDILTGKSKRYLGHNPLGDMMIIALLLSLLATGVTGLALPGAGEEHYDTCLNHSRNYLNFDLNQNRRVAAGYHSDRTATD
jgi:cytochrome b